MVSFDKDALICDFAETYHIFNIWDFDVDYIAILAWGLRNDSRIKMSMSGQSVPLKTMLSAMIVDNTNWLVWSKTKDAEHNRNKPKSIMEMLTPKQKTANYQEFDSPNDFLRYRKQIINSQS